MLLKQLVLIREGCDGRARGQVQLREDVADVAINGALADRELVSDGAVRSTGCDQPDDLPIALCQPPRW